MVRRKDNRGRVLNDGEMQRKDGKYAYQYTDITGKRKTVYSWRLTASDRTPSGKKKDDSLREKEKKIKKDLSSGIIPCGGNMSVIELLMKYTSQKTGVKYKTMLSYQYAINVLKQYDFGKQRIDRIKISDAKGFFIKLQSDGKSYGTIYDIRGVIKPAFQMAIDDDLIRKNPFSFQLANVIIDDTVSRISLTEKQENDFLEFIKNDEYFSKYYDVIYVLFNTGIRISEFCGLTVKNIDFKNKKIIVDSQLLSKGKGEYEIIRPKSKAGIREIPMTDSVSECFKRIILTRKYPDVEPMIGGKTGFLFFNRFGKPVDLHNWDSRFYNIWMKYNRTHDVQLPKITPHVCRHTFCSKMANAGINPKTLQYIAGHSNVKTTLNTYTHVDFENAMEEMQRIVESKQIKNAL